MTQTNNERELIERLALVDIDLRRSHNGFDFIASLSELEAFAKAYKTASDEKSISQNEQQEAVAYTDGEGDFITKEMYDEYLKLGFYTECIVPLFTSPPKQIPDGWKYDVLVEALRTVMNEAEEIVLHDTNFVAVPFEIFYKMEDEYEALATSANNE